MHTYGLRNIYQRGCCPGHDPFPRDSYRNRRSVKKHRLITKIYRRIERRVTRMALRCNVSRDD